MSVKISSYIYDFEWVLASPEKKWISINGGGAWKYLKVNKRGVAKRGGWKYLQLCLVVICSISFLHNRANDVETDS